jgi:DNA-binding NarL/FixJ family response regulator
MDGPLRIVVADDHPLFRKGMVAMLSAVPGFAVVGEAATGAEAIEAVAASGADVVLMDLQMPEMDGLAATRLISVEAPDVHVVILTASEDEAHLFEAIKSGAQGYLLKNLQAEQFFHLLEGVSRGEPALTPSLARKLLAEFAQPRPSSRSDPDPDALTEREHEVLTLLVQGITSNRELAERLVISENTVKYHLRNILNKLHVQNRAQVVAHALRHGLVDQPSPDLDR